MDVNYRTAYIESKDGTYTNVEETWARKDDNCPYTAAAFTSSICEWTWDDQPSGNSKGNGSFSADPTTGTGEFLIPCAARSDSYNQDNGYYAEYIKDWNNNTNSATATSNDQACMIGTVAIRYF